MPDQVKQSTSLPAPREPNRFANTNAFNELLASLGQVLLGDGKTRITGVQLVPFRLETAEPIETNRWKYSGIRMAPQRSQAGEDAYAADASPNAGTNDLYNDAEERNAAGFTGYGGSGSFFGNGVGQGSLPSGFTLQPVQHGLVVWARPVAVIDGSSIITEWRFCVMNGIDGACAV